MQIPEPVTCRSCSRVMMAGDAAAYTPLRGRLIVERGYCLCPAKQEAPAPAGERQAGPQDVLSLLDLAPTADLRAVSLAAAPVPERVQPTATR
ncbi:hypothetical protein [Planomonospora parontospora]|uniref:hypothetical protein n=1 Tax=Planomonospora parontospora TaxID=58119 RepID=UPI0016708BCF|nr:hypothetical protein [Planomonospora parontospora]GGL50142.1 hypothetical protein GCM10014719_59260 [Planomonospora parontospora subsp. antibiotica]GII19268.1 hypothetical protein Ppa05_59940 [Planomonospora parontospora subsp. antibiotica]